LQFVYTNHESAPREAGHPTSFSGSPAATPGDAALGYTPQLYRYLSATFAAEIRLCRNSKSPEQIGQADFQWHDFSIGTGGKSFSNPISHWVPMATARSGHALN
jgi:hypothetical protein